MPFQVVSGGNRITLLAQFDAPREGSSVWGAPGLRRHRGAGLRRAGRSELRSSSTASCCGCASIPTKQRIDLEPSELGNADLGLALTGSLDFSSDDPRLALGIASTPMSVAAMKRLWPVVTAPEGARLGRRPSSGRYDRAARHLDQCTVVHAQVERPAGPR